MYCLEGAGFTSVAGVAAPISAGQHVRWPAHTLHRLWTEGETMVTPTYEHLGQATGNPAPS